MAGMVALVMLLLTTTGLFVGLYCGLKSAEEYRRSESRQYLAERELLAVERQAFDGERHMAATATNALVTIAAQQPATCVER